MTFLFLVIKYIFRTIHMASYAMIFGNIALDFFFGQRSKSLESSEKSKFLLLHIAFSILLVLSGLINMIILIKENKYSKNMAHAIWKYLLITKFFLSLVLTPLLEKFLPLNYFSSKNINALTFEEKSQIFFKIRLGVTLGLFLISPFLRFLREYGMKPTKKLIKIE
jgi:hypothetical protein